MHWSDELGKNNTYNKLYIFSLDLGKKDNSKKKIARLTLNKELSSLEETLTIDDLPFIIEENTPFSIELNMVITGDNYSVTKPLNIEPNLKVGEVSIEYISNTEIYKEGVLNDPTPSIEEIVLRDNVGLLNKDDLVELKIVSDQVFFNIDAITPSTNLKILVFSEDKIVLTNLDNEGADKRFFIKNIPISYQDNTNEGLQSYGIEMTVKSDK